MDKLIIFDDEHFMRQALRQAENAWRSGEVPVGAVAVRDGVIIARAFNQVEMLKDATAHAEMLVLTQAASVLKDWRLLDVDIYVTKEPCAMCAGAMVNSRVRRLVFGARDERAGAAGSALDISSFEGMLHRLEVRPAVLEDECAAMLKDFFKQRRREKEARSTDL